MSKRMTKVLSLILTLVMFLSVSTPAFAWGDIGIGSGWGREIGEDDMRDFEPDEEPEEGEEYDYFSAFDEDSGINVTVEAPMGSLPLLAEVRVEPVPVDDVRDVVDEVMGYESNVLVAMDISFWLDDIEIEPEEPVRVKIAAPELDGREDLTLVHIPDEAEPETIDLIPEDELTFKLGTNEICFESGDFSVYAVIGGSANDKKLTVEFYESATATTPLSTQVLVLEQFDEAGEAPLIDPGVPTITATQSFEGWRIDAEHENMDVTELNTYIHENYANMTGNEATLRVNAMIFNVRYVIYHDQSGAVLRTQSFHVEEGGTASVTISHPYVAFMDGQNFKAWTLEEYVDVEGDYPLYKTGAEDHLYQNDTAYNLSDTIDLYPYVQNGNWMIYDNNIGQDDDPTTASFTSPVFVPEGANTVAPSTPTRTGYTFGGWYTEDTLTNKFIFNTTIGQDTTVYAKWIPAQAQYTVVFWQQAANDTVDDNNLNNQYVYYASVVRTDKVTGQTATLSNADKNMGGVVDSNMGYYFTYNADKTGEPSEVVRGDGSTVLNVYYDRRVITYHFYGDLVSYNYSYSSYNANYPYYGYSNGSYFRVYRSGNYWYTDTSYNTRYNGTVYRVRYTQGTSTASSAEIEFGSISGLYFSTMDSFDWSQANTTISGDDWPYSGRYLMWHEQESGRYQNKAFQYETGADDVTEKNYFLAEYEVSSTTRPYTCLGQDENGDYTVTLDDDALKSNETVYFKGSEYFGYTLSRYNRTSNNFDNATVWDGNEVSCSYNQIGSNGHAYFYYARNKWNFVYESNNSDVKTEPVYWQGDLSDLASYVPTNGPDGCYFDGWYADPGFGTEYDFSQEMPNHSVRVYAKWTTTRYRVVLDPTGGDSSVGPDDVTFPGNQATTFRVDYGEQIQASSINNATRQGYILLGWFLDPEFTQPFNFAQPVTDAVADMNYINASDADRQGSDPWNLDDNGQPKTYSDVGLDNVRGKVTIYAHWREDPDGVVGVNVRYDAVESTEHKGYFSGDAENRVTIKDDPDIYADQAQAYAQPASTPEQYDPELKFLYWDILDKNGQSSGRKAYPGQTWEVHFEDAVEEPITNGNAVEDPEFYTFERGNLRLVRPGDVAPMAQETRTVYIPVDTIEVGAEYLIGVKSNGIVYLVVNYSPLGNNYYIQDGPNYDSTYGDYNSYLESYTAQAVLDSDGYVTGINDTTASGLDNCLWKFSSTSGGTITSCADSSRYLYGALVVGTYNNSENYIRAFFPYTSSTTWTWDSSRSLLYTTSTVSSTTYYVFPQYYSESGTNVAYARISQTMPDDGAVQLYKKTEITVGPTEYTVTFVDGYTNTVISTQQVEEGTSATAPDAPDHTADGKVFTGWDTDYSNVTADITVTAQYADLSSRTYTVTFRYMDGNGQWTSVSQDVHHGSAATPPSIPDLQSLGYTFNCWDKRYDSITASITINAVYKQVATTKYVVTLRAVYGRADAGSVTHINWYSNTYDGYGNPIPNANTVTTYKTTSQLFPNNTIEEKSSDSKATFTYEGDPTYGEHGYNLVYDNVEIPESVLIPEKPYDIPGYTFKGWARVPTTEDIADFNLNNEGDDVYIRWVEDNSETGAGHYEAKGSIKLSQNYSLVGYWSGADQNTGYQFNNNGTLTVTFNTDAYVCVKEPGGAWYMIDGTYSAGTTGSVLVKKNGEKLFVPGNTEVTFTLTENSDGSLFLSYVEGRPETQSDENWVPVTYVAANEQKPYHDMYAVWEGSFQIYHSGVAGGAIETVPINFKGTYDLTKHVGTANRADPIDKVLYGGYYLKGGFTAPAPVVAEGETEAKIPAYDGTNWTWTTAQTENGMSMTPKAGETYYIKEVPADKYLQPYFHFTYRKDTDPAAQTLDTAWLISDIDDCKYKETGFVIVTDDNKANVCTSLTVQNTVGGTKVELKPETIFRGKGVTSGYLSYLEVMRGGTTSNGFGTSSTVLQYWVTPDGLIVTGTTQRIYSMLDTKTNAKSGVQAEPVASTIAVFETQP